MAGNGAKEWAWTSAIWIWNSIPIDLDLEPRGRTRRLAVLARVYVAPSYWLLMWTPGLS